MFHTKMIKIILLSVGLMVSLYAEDTILKQCQFSITQTTKEQVFNYGSILSYELNITNTGEDNCYNIVTSSTLLKNMTIILDSVSDEWSCWNDNKNPQTVGCSYKDTLLASTMAMVPLKFNVKVAKQKDIKNVSWMKGDSFRSCTEVKGLNSISSKAILSTSTNCFTLSLVKPLDVNAGKDINMTIGDTILITGNANDSHERVLQYKWQDENNITLATTASFEYVSVKIGTYLLTLTVTSDDNATGSDTMVVTVSKNPNNPSIVDAGKDRNVTLANMPIQITCNATDIDGKIIGYKWYEHNDELADTAKFTYDSPIVGKHTLTCITTDDDNASTSDTMVVIVSENLNKAPIADAGKDRNVTLANMPIQITCNATDIDGKIIGYKWYENGVEFGNTAVLEYNSSIVGKHTLTCIVTDDDNTTGSDTMVVIVSENPNKAPIADAGKDRNVTLANMPIQITCNATDIDGKIIGYKWYENGVEFGNTAVLEYNSSIVGKHTLTCIVTDDDNTTGSDTMVVIVSENPNKAPIADAGKDRNVTLANMPIQITCNATDIDGKIIGHKWYENGVEFGNTAVLEYNSSIVGKHTLTCIVTDDDNTIGSDTMVVTVSENPNKAPIVNAGEDINVTLASKPIHITCNAHDNDGDIIGYKWYENNTKLANTAVLEYNPLKEGIHTLTCIATDDDNATGSDTMDVTVF